jgi:predicted nucleic acid-binding protein
VSGTDIPRVKMYLVVDPNTIISAALMKGNVSRVFSLNYALKKFDFIAPQFLVVELGKHTGKISEKTKFTPEEVNKKLQFILKQITFIQDSVFEENFNVARSILAEHEKDAPYLALALAFDCKIFSGDKVLKSFIPDRVVSPSELLEEF